MAGGTRWADDDPGRDDEPVRFIGTPDRSGDEAWDGSDPDARHPNLSIFREPYFRAVAPNLDRVSRRTWEPGTVSRRRAVSALRFLLVAIGLVVALPLIGWLLGQL